MLCFIGVSEMIRLSLQNDGSEACNFIKKETRRNVFFCKFCIIFKNTSFIEHLRWLLLKKIPYSLLLQAIVGTTFFIKSMSTPNMNS